MRHLETRVCSVHLLYQSICTRSLHRNFLRPTFLLWQPQRNYDKWCSLSTFAKKRKSFFPNCMINFDAESTKVETNGQIVACILRNLSPNLLMWSDLLISILCTCHVWLETLKFHLNSLVIFFLKFIVVIRPRGSSSLFFQCVCRVRHRLTIPKCKRRTFLYEKLRKFLSSSIVARSELLRSDRVTEKKESQKMSAHLHLPNVWVNLWGKSSLKDA